MKKCILLILTASLLACQSAKEEFPQATISNGLLTAKLYLPDAEKGYYRGSRFDWSGVMPELKYKGHDYFGQWFPIYDPTIHDAISGPVEEFMQIGYEEAPVGGEFLRIGIGGLLKPVEERFNRFGYYEFTNPGKWTVKKAKDNVVFIHELNNVAGYSYVYEKTVRFVKNKPEMIIEHSLKNTGNKAIQTSVYNHNFFTLDHQQTGPDITVKFTFPVSVTREHPDLIVNGQQLGFARVLGPTEDINIGQLQGHNNSVADYDIRFEHAKTGAGVRVTCDRPLFRMVFWACDRAVSAEPFTELNIQPGETFTWNITYDFYTL